MKKLFFAAALCTIALLAQEPSPTASPNEVETLRQQVQALTEMVKSLQQQVKDQADTLAKMNPTLPPCRH